MEYKVGDWVIGIKNDPVFPHIEVIGKVGIIVEIVTNNYRYGIQWNENICPRAHTIRYQSFNYFNEKDIKPYLTKLKLKKLLQGD